MTGCKPGRQFITSPKDGPLYIHVKAVTCSSAAQRKRSGQAGRRRAIVRQFDENQG